MREEIQSLAEILTSPSEEERELLKLLCAAAEREVLGRLRSENDWESCRETCLCAAAWLAAAGLLTGRAARAGESFTVGDVSISGDKGQLAERAICLRRQALELLRPYCADQNFAFRGVAG